jgi:hypothetical protein
VTAGVPQPLPPNADLDLAVGAEDAYEAHSVGCWRESPQQTIHEQVYVNYWMLQSNERPAAEVAAEALRMADAAAEQYRSFDQRSP